MAKTKTKQNELVTGQAPYDTPSTKSDHIRAYLRNHRNKQQRRPSVIVSHLADHGIEVRTELVSHVKRHPLKGRKGGRAVTTEKSNNRSQAQQKAWRKRKRQDAQVEALIAAKQLLSAVGGSRERATDALDTIERINAS